MSFRSLQRFALATAITCASVLGAATTARGQVPPEGSYERLSLDRALEEEQLELEPNPEGKTVRAIHVRNFEVFSPRDGAFLRWFNLFHFTTHEGLIEREIILRPGMVWDDTKVKETLRKLRDPLLTTLVVIVPVKAPESDKVDILAVTRDVWSLRFNSNFELQEGKVTDLTLSISENNFFGYRKQLAAVLDMNASELFLGPRYIDRNISGTRLRLSTQFGPLFKAVVKPTGHILSRSGGEIEGSRSSTSFSYPLWSLDSKWGAGVSVSHFDGVARSFEVVDGEGIVIRTYDAPETPEVEEVPRVYRLRSAVIEPVVTRSFGTEWIHRVSLGHELSFQRPELPDGFNEPDAVRDSFIANVMPRSERNSVLFARYVFFQPRFVEYRDISSYDLSEDARLGPDVSVEMGPSLELIGSESNFFRLSATVGYTFDWNHDGYVRVAAGAGGRLDTSEMFDNLVSFAGKVVTPRQLGAFRVVAQGLVRARINETQNRSLSLGGSSGLRGYPLFEYFVDTSLTGGKAVSVLGNLEVRSMPIKVWFTRIGALAFWDAGHAAPSLGDIRFKHDIGLGFRWLIPQLSPLVYRIDWAIPLNGRTAGFPGRFTAGVAQVF